MNTPPPLQTRDEITNLRRQLWAQGHRPLAVRTGGKEPDGMNWTGRARANPPFAAINPAQSWALNTGLLCDGLRAVDIDVDYPARANALRELAFATLGGAPARWRANSHRILLLYRAAEGAPKKRAIVSGVFKSTDDKAEKVEVLGYGQQFVAHGNHPSGAPLEWWPLPPDQFDRAALTPVTEDQITAFLAEAAKIIAAPIEHATAPPRPAVAPSHGGYPLASPEPAGNRERAYAADALARNAAELADLHSGRNRACNAIAFRMGRMVAAGWIEREIVEGTLYAAMEINGWRADNRHGDRKAWATLQSGLTNGMQRPHPPLEKAPNNPNQQAEWQAVWRAHQEYQASLCGGVTK